MVAEGESLVVVGAEAVRHINIKPLFQLQENRTQAIMNHNVVYSRTGLWQNLFQGTYVFGKIIAHIYSASFWAKFKPVNVLFCEVGQYIYYIRTLVIGNSQ